MSSRPHDDVQLDFSAISFLQRLAFLTTRPRALAIYAKAPRDFNLKIVLTDKAEIENKPGIFRVNRRQLLGRLVTGPRGELFVETLDSIGYSLFEIRMDKTGSPTQLIYRTAFLSTLPALQDSGLSSRIRYMDSFLGIDRFGVRASDSLGSKIGVFDNRGLALDQWLGSSVAPSATKYDVLEHNVSAAACKELLVATAWARN